MIESGKFIEIRKALSRTGHTIQRRSLWKMKALQDKIDINNYEFKKVPRPKEIT